MRCICYRFLGAVVFMLAGAFSLPALALQVVGCGEVETFCHGDQGDCPCANNSSLGGCLNGIGEAGLLSVTGDGVVGPDNLVLSASRLPALTPTIFFTSRTAGRLPFVNGLLCLDPFGTRIIRLGPPVQASIDGVASIGPGLIAQMAANPGPPDGIVNAGSTWYFQSYYRDPGHCVDVANTTNAIRVLFATPPISDSTRISGRVFYDLNKGGVFEVGLPGELPIAGWKVNLQGLTSTLTTYTDSLGRYEFSVPQNHANYRIISVPPAPGYIPLPGGTRLATGPDQVPVVADQNDICVDLGQLVLENRPDLARSVSFWSEFGGATLEACDPEWRVLINSLCLRTAVTNPNGNAGTIYRVSLTDPFNVAFNDFHNYMVGAENDVLAYTLSKQFAAANLNVACGVLEHTVYIDRNNDGVLVNLQEMIAGTLALLCQTCAANTGPNGDLLCRQMIRECLHEWSGMNSNGSSIWARGDRIDLFTTPY